MKKSTKFLLAIISFSILTSCESVLMGISGEQPATFRVKENKAYVNGVLGKKAHANFLEMIGEHPNVNTLVLQKVPGSVNDDWNVKTCIAAHQKGLRTELESTSIIESGGVDLFIAGVERISQEGAKIGVHSWRTLTKDGTKYPPDHEEHQVFYDYFEAINRDTSFYWFTLRAAPGNGMHYMTKEEIDKYNLVTEWKK